MEIFSADKPQSKVAKIHFLNRRTGKSFCRRGSATWLDEETISGGANVTRDPSLVTCKLCLKYKKIWNN